ncbi:hypothetical protein [Brevibacillus sp. VP]|uniref:hypothetical protein n=1 Tax=unclassified Brevibacillus TaxID=2684853 RepID=UPI000E2E9E8C|nr:hypothetical protein [Brevibacillus sp. VP]RFB34027.1 hypothetical protein DZB91_12290 [Brevibacillus sp. VP]
MKNSQRDIKDLQLFQIMRQQYMGQLVESFKQFYREKNRKEPNKEFIEAFMKFLEKENLIDKMLESAFHETMDHLKGNTGIQNVAVTAVEHPLEKTSNKFVEKNREIIVIPFILAIIVYAFSSESWVIGLLLSVVIVFLAFGWWQGRKA